MNAHARRVIAASRSARAARGAKAEVAQERAGSDSEPILVARNLTKAYSMGGHPVQALAGVDFKVAKGDFVAIMGPSGSGKSTLLHILGGLDKPSGGELILGGQSIASMSDDQITLTRRHSVGFVFQFFNLLPTLTAEENVALPLIIDGQDARKYQERIVYLMELVGLGDRRGHKPDQLSGGEQQRVSIARALVTEPAIVLADEPTGNLDSKTGRAIMDLLRRSCDELGQTIVMVTHDPRAAMYADRTVFLRDGLVTGEVHCAGAHPAGQLHPAGDGHPAGALDLQGEHPPSMDERLRLILDAMERYRL